IDQSAVCDLCDRRRSYNKNEIRFGGGAARIIDYAIESQGHRDATNIRFGAQVQLYVKVLFCRDVEMPLIGFAVKTLEGIEVFATNTFLMGTKVKAVCQGQICVFRFSFKLRVKPGDYFFDIGVAEVDGTRGGALLDLRRSVAHCIVLLDGERFF